MMCTKYHCEALKLKKKQCESNLSVVNFLTSLGSVKLYRFYEEQDLRIALKITKQIWFIIRFMAYIVCIYHRYFSFLVINLKIKNYIKVIY